jgi:hypothetical protein
MVNKLILLDIRNNPIKLGKILGYNDLNEIHNEWIKYCWLTKEDVTLQAHRNSYKTSSIIVLGIIWNLIFNPNDTILLVRKSEEKASDTIDEITRYYNSEKLKRFYKNYLGKDLTVITSNRKKILLSTKTNTSREANVEVLGMTGNLTGSHYDKILLDDIITMIDRYSLAERENSKKFIRETINIKKTSGKRIITGTTWHIDDGFSILPEAKKYPIGTTGIKFFEEKENIARLRQEIGNEAIFSANYLLKHIPDEGRVIDDPKFSAMEDDFEFQAWLDPAYTGKDTTALTILAKRRGNVYILGWVWKKSITELYQVIVNLLTSYKCGTLYIETNADKGLSVIEFQKYYPAVRGINETQNKHIKILTYVKNNWKNIFFIDSISEDYINQVLSYEEGKGLDDAVDSLASIIRQIGIDNQTKNTYIESIDNFV